MTTSPKRIWKLKPTIDSLLRQIYTPDMIYVNVPRVFRRTGDRFDGIIPDFLRDPRITVNTCDDMGPITKLLGVLDLETEPSTSIITVDDDISYDPILVGTLVEHSIAYPEACISAEAIGKDVILQGFAGVLYPRHVLTDSIIESLCVQSQISECYISDDLIISNVLHEYDVPIFGLEQNHISSRGRIILPYGLQSDAIHKTGLYKNYIDCSVELNKRDVLHVDYFLKWQGKYNRHVYFMHTEQT